MFKLSIITDEVSTGLDEALDFALETGLNGVELRNIGDRSLLELSYREIETLASKIRLAGLEVSALATPLFKCPLYLDTADTTSSENDPFTANVKDWREHLPLFTRAAQIANILGATFIRCFAFYKSKAPLSSVRELILIRLQAAAQCVRAINTQIKICIENEPTTYLRSLQDVLDLMPSVPSPYKLLWDPGNAFSVGEYSLDTFKIHPYIGHIHLKDSKVENETVSFVPLGEGMIPYAELLRQWKSAGYQGYLTLEPHLSIGQSSFEGSKRSVEHLKHLIAELEGF